MLTDLYKEIQRLAGDKFVKGKIYKFETYIFPPNHDNQSLKLFDSKITETIPSQNGLVQIGQSIKINFEEDSLKNL